MHDFLMHTKLLLVYNLLHANVLVVAYNTLPS